MCSCTIVDGWNIMPGRSSVVLANGGLSDYAIKDTGADRSKLTLIKAQFSTLNTTAAPKEGHRVSRRLHRSVCMSSGEGYEHRSVCTSSGEGYKLTTATVCTSVTIHFRWGQVRPPTTLPCSRSPHNAVHSPSLYT